MRGSAKPSVRQAWLTAAALEHAQRLVMVLDWTITAMAREYGLKRSVLAPYSSGYGRHYGHKAVVNQWNAYQASEEVVDLKVKCESSLAFALLTYAANAVGPGHIKGGLDGRLSTVIKERHDGLTAEDKKASLMMPPPTHTVSDSRALCSSGRKEGRKKGDSKGVGVAEVRHGKLSGEEQAPRILSMHERLEQASVEAASECRSFRLLQLAPSPAYRCKT
jgi:hypothetical protein